VWVFNDFGSEQVGMDVACIVVENLIMRKPGTVAGISIDLLLLVTRQDKEEKSMTDVGIVI
jgi:hypothetical protein